MVEKASVIYLVQRIIIVVDAAEMDKFQDQSQHEKLHE